ncbi:hypothetical protein V7x_55010 [Crateriforma conspicua]|uniref:VWFA domain-containing protein n=1 Tax=Crateriforma conspicua TaxID=2527996 RepID=A0A5C6FHS7_9PLAN|nr:vWA domain-containing protein [Crateriforma conspicua]TWU59591.1 hypothetical protein V7x_55010 [Crateriforma conspicua]
MKRRRNRGPLWTMMTDVGFQLIAVLLVLVTNFKSEANSAKLAAVELQEDNDGLWEENHGLKGQLEDTEEELENYAENGKRQQGIINRLTKDLGVLGEQLGEKTEELNKLRPGGPVDIVMIADCSDTMTPHHERLKKAQLSLFQWAPRLSSRCRVGVLGVRDGVVYRYPLTTINPPWKDGGKSQSQLIDFMTGVKTSPSLVNHAPAFDEALAMLPDSHRATRKQVIILLGDIGPSELDGSGYVFSAREMSVAKDVASRVRRWAEKGSRSVGSIYVGPDQQTSIDRKWFQSLAYPSGQNFATDSTELFNVIFKAIEQK